MFTSARKLLLFLTIAPFAFGQGSQLPKYTVATLPSASNFVSYTVQVIDGVNRTDCTVGGATGTNKNNVLCTAAWNGSTYIWVPISTGSPSGPLDIQHNGTSVPTQNPLNFIDTPPSIPPGYNAVTFENDGAGGMAGVVPAANISNGIEMQTGSPTAGTFIKVYPDGVTVSGTGTQFTAAGDTRSGFVQNGGCVFACSGVGPADVSWTFTLPSYVNPSNVTAVWASSTGFTAPTGNNTGYGSQGVISCKKPAGSEYVIFDGYAYDTAPKPLIQRNVHMTDSGGSDISTIVCSAHVGGTGPIQAGFHLDVTSLYLQLADAVDTAPADTAVQVVPPLKFDSALNTLSLFRPPDIEIDAGTADDYVINDSGLNIVAGMSFRFIPSANNTSTLPHVTVNGARQEIVGPTGGAVVANDIATTAVIQLVEGPNTKFWLQNPQTSSGGGGSISGQTAGYAIKAATATTATAPFPLDDGVTTASTMTAHEAFAIADGSGAAGAVKLKQGTAASNGTTSVSLTVPSSVTSYRIMLPGVAPTSGNNYLSCTAADPAVCTWAAGSGAFAGGLGTSYQDVSEIAAPANPSAGVDRLYTNSTTHKLACLTSGGADCMPSGGGGSAWSSLTDPTGNLSLSMAGNLSTFSGTDAMNTSTASAHFIVGLNTWDQTYTAQQSISAIAGGANVPSTGTQHQVNGLYGAVVNDSTSVNGVGMYSTCVSTRSGAPCWGDNPLASDTASASGTLIGSEVNVNILNASTTATGILINGFWTAQPSAANGIILQRNGGTTGQWDTGLWISRGVTRQSGVLLDAVAAGANQASQILRFINTSGGSTNQNNDIYADGTGALVLAPISGTTKVTNLNISGTCTGCGTTTANALTMNNSGSGDTSGSTFNGSAAKTISYNSIGAAPTASPTFTGTPDASGATQFKLPVSTTATTSADGEVKYDSTDKNWHLWANGADKILAPLASGFVSGNCGQPTKTGNSWTIQDAGGACGVSGGGSAFSAITTGSNTTATMTVGSGASMDVSGTGTINATKIGGITVTGTPVTGYVPTATSSSAATWQAASAGNYVNLGGSVTWTGCTYASGVCTTTGSVASIDMASIPSGYNQLKIFVLGSANSGGSFAVTCQFSGDTGSHYAGEYVQASNTTVSAGNQTTTSAVTCGTLGAASFAGAFEMSIPFYSTSTAFHVARTHASQVGGSLGTASNFFLNDFDFWWQPASPSAINEVKLNGGSNFASGTLVSIYGIN